MKKLTALAIFAIASFAFAGDGTAIRNVCDSLALGEQPMVELVPNYIDEYNWYGNPHNGVKDSSTFIRHESYQTIEIKTDTLKKRLPLLVQAKCSDSDMMTLEYATWNNSKQWVKKSADNYATRIYDIHALSMQGHDSTNTYNLLAYVPNQLPDNYSFNSEELLFSKTFEFAFEWWFAAVHYVEVLAIQEGYQRIRNHYGSSAGNDSLKVVRAALNAAAVPDSISSVRIQVVKVVLVDSRKPLAPESSSSVTSSSSANPVSSSVTESSSSSKPVSSSSSKPASSSSVVVSSSSQPSSSSKTPESSSSVVPSSSSKQESSSSSKPVSSSSEGKSSSSATPGSSSVGKSSSSEAPKSSSEGSKPKSSSSKKQESSSSGSDRIMVLGGEDASRYVVQVRRLDGTVAKDSKKLGPGVYYVKYSDGTWQKKALLLK